MTGASSRHEETILIQERPLSVTLSAIKVAPLSSQDRPLHSTRDARTLQGQLLSSRPSTHKYRLFQVHAHASRMWARRVEPSQGLNEFSCFVLTPPEHIWSLPPAFCAPPRRTRAD